MVQVLSEAIPGGDQLLETETARRVSELNESVVDLQQVIAAREAAEIAVRDQDSRQEPVRSVVERESQIIEPATEATHRSGVQGANLRPIGRIATSEPEAKDEGALNADDARELVTAAIEGKRAA